MSSFLDRAPSSIEAVLERSMGGKRNPYDWLDRSVAKAAKNVLVVVSGAGRMVERVKKPGRLVVGVDRSRLAVMEGVSRGRREFVLGDANYLPFGAETFDAVVSDLGLSVNENRAQMLSEIHRVLRPGGMFAGLAPALRPVNVAELGELLRLGEVLRVRPHLTGQAEFRIKKLLAAAGLQKLEDSRAKFYFEVRDRSDAEQLISGLRATKDPERAQEAVEYLVERAGDEGLKIPLPMRRVLATK